MEHILDLINSHLFEFNIDHHYFSVFKTTALKTISHADYLLSGDRFNYLVKTAVLTSQFTMLPVKDVETAFTNTR